MTLVAGYTVNRARIVAACLVSAHRCVILALASHQFERDAAPFIPTGCAELLFAVRCCSPAPSRMPAQQALIVCWCSLQLLPRAMAFSASGL